ncbi:Methyltransferase domain-containing protein [Kosakonia oryzendophytica]|uniref:Methyltransferase domain-containing protein n=1 Tax=Kosakonia oryzendophytica TaxID=1005665 RepID=A0A1C4CR95_9ENTR|nr:class I SAM-dependent methyltransferase [Kosakonia oryzendophytica]SCC21657.1 Methyltransferase domain-containing protein [Kosakonia oryzendophytica]
MAVNHHQLTEQQFGDQAQAYLQSQVHAQGADLVRLAQWLADDTSAAILDLGCGAGHASFVAAGIARAVTAYDLSEKMLDVVRQAAHERHLANITTSQGAAEKLPFADSSFDVVISRYSAHHWHDVAQALREVKRVLKPGGKFILMDIASPGQPVLDIWLQTIEVLRDPSHVRNYSPAEWLHMTQQSGMTVQKMATDRLALEYNSWVERMKTPEVLRAAIRYLQNHTSEEVKQHFRIREDGSFTSDTLMFQTQA